MRYGQIRQFDVANGEGIRSSLFVTGCTHRCPQCFNEEYQSFSAGKLWDKESENLLITYLKNPQVSGLSLLGGEPMENTSDLIPLLQRVQKEVSKNIWIYSGYTFEEILAQPKMKELLTYTQVLVDGKFIHEKKDLTLLFRGSSNQRVIDVQKSLASNRVILYLK